MGQKAYLPTSSLLHFIGKINRNMENRTFIPGSEWIYFKLYTGTNSADTILKNEIHKYIWEMIKNSIIDKWFFIRYNDPDFHIRLRLHLKEKRNFTYVFIKFFETVSPIVNTGIAWKIQCDTYQREMERYGTNSILMVEDLFCIDSKFILSLLHQLNDENSEKHRWKIALVLIDSFLTAFSFDLSQKMELLNTMAESYKKEFGFMYHQDKKQLNGKYRTYRYDIDKTMLWEKETSEIIDIIKARLQAIIPVAEKLAAKENSGDLQISLKALLTSIIHMTMNRWFRSKNRLYELVLYDFMSRYYSSEIAKKG